MGEPCQRWRDRRATYRPAGEPIDTSKYGVELLPNDEAARAFAARGAHVVLAVRDEAKGRAAAAGIAGSRIAGSGIAGSTEVRRLDLADLASVRAFAAGWIIAKLARSK